MEAIVYPAQVGHVMLSLRSATAVFIIRLLVSLDKFPNFVAQVIQIRKTTRPHVLGEVIVRILRQIFLWSCGPYWWKLVKVEKSVRNFFNPGIDPRFQHHYVCSDLSHYQSKWGVMTKHSLLMATEVNTDNVELVCIIVRSNQSRLALLLFTWQLSMSSLSPSRFRWRLVLWVQRDFPFSHTGSWYVNVLKFVPIALDLLSFKDYESCVLKYLVYPGIKGQ